MSDPWDTPVCHLMAMRNAGQGTPERCLIDRNLNVPYFCALIRSKRLVQQLIMIAHLCLALETSKAQLTSLPNTK